MIDPAEPLPDEFYQAIPGADPCGAPVKKEDLDRVKRLCTATPGGFDQLGNLQPDTPPRYTAAMGEAEDLLRQSRDLSLLTYLVEIYSAEKGALGLHAALHLLHSLVQDNWEHVFPRAVPASNQRGWPQLSAKEAQAVRSSALRRLNAQRASIRKNVLAAPLVQAQAGREPFSLRDLFGAVGIDTYASRTPRIAPEAFGPLVALPDVADRIRGGATALDAASGIAYQLYQTVLTREDLSGVDLGPLTQQLSDLAIAAASLVETMEAELQEMATNHHRSRTLRCHRYPQPVL